MKKYLQQKGAFLILTALALPVLLAMAGLAIDAGNLYLQKIRLQNAADAAALAGAQAYQDNKETVSQHPRADKTAEKYLTGEYNNLSRQEALSSVRYKAVEENSLTYYCVRLEKEVPLFFIKLVYAKDTVSVPVVSAASFRQEAQVSASFPNLFTFRDGFQTLNANQNPDNIQIAQISSTFSGHIVATTQSGYDNISNRHDILVTNEAKDKIKDNPSYSVADAKRDNLINTPLLDTDYDLYAFVSAVKEKMNASQAKYFDGQDQDLTISRINSKYLANTETFVFTNANGGGFRFDEPVAGSAAQPLYIVVTQAGNVKLHLNSSKDNARPVVFCYLGSSEIWMDGSGSFRGIIYAPYAKININDNGLKFKGSMVAKEFYLGGKGTYTYQDFGIGGGSAGSSSGQASGKAITLSVPPSVSW